jgi:hypothetical protein
VIVHETEGENPHRHDRESVDQRLMKGQKILVRAKKIASADAAVHNMIDYAARSDASGSWHDPEGK